jgi:Flp pilus assembly protein TadG
MIGSKRNRKREGAVLVEMAAVVAVLMLLLFGIFEYCRIVFVRQVVVNAAREGARYAVVNTLDTTVVSDTQAYVKTRMSGLDKQAKTYDCQVYLSDAGGNNIGPAANAGFGQYIAVQVDYDYTPVLPSFLFMSGVIRISSKSLMYSEAN